MIKVGKFLIGFVTADAIMTACGGTSRLTYGIVLAVGVALICAGCIRKRILRQREAVVFRCRMKRKIAPSDSLARTGAIE